MQTVGGLGPSSEAEAEEIAVTDVDEDCMRQDVSSNETLDVLTLKRRLKNRRFEYDVVGKNEPHKILVTGDIRG